MESSKLRGVKMAFNKQNYLLRVHMCLPGFSDYEILLCY